MEQATKFWLQPHPRILGIAVRGALSTKLPIRKAMLSQMFASVCQSFIAVE